MLPAQYMLVLLSCMCNWKNGKTNVAISTQASNLISLRLNLPISKHEVLT